MLLLNRKVGEIIRIGDDIVVQVREMGRGKVRLGIIAPKDKEVHRQEVYEKIHGDPKLPADAIKALKSISN